MRRIYETSRGNVRTKVVPLINDVCLDCCLFTMNHGSICVHTMIMHGKSKGIMANKLCSKLDQSVDNNKAVIFEKAE